MAGMIDRQNEIVAIATGNALAILNQLQLLRMNLEIKGIDVVKTKEHEDLVDVKGGGWYTFVDYVLKHQGKSDADLEQFWWEMYQNENTREDMSAKGYEHLGDIATRTEKLQNFCEDLCVDTIWGKTLRVISVASDINIEQIQQKRNTDREQRPDLGQKR